MNNYPENSTPQEFASGTVPTGSPWSGQGTSVITERKIAQKDQDKTFLAIIGMFMSINTVILLVLTMIVLPLINVDILPFVSADPGTIFTQQGADINGSYFFTPFVNGKIMGVVLLVCCLLVLLTVVWIPKIRYSATKLAIPVFVLFATAAYYVAFCVVYFLDPHVAELYELGGHFDVGYYFILIFAVLFLLAGWFILVAGRSARNLEAAKQVGYFGSPQPTQPTQPTYLNQPFN